MALMRFCLLCSTRVPVGVTYCEKHLAEREKLAAEARQKQDQRRGSSAERGYDYWWQRQSKMFLREHPLCVECLAKGQVVPATVVDHIKPHRGNRELFRDPMNWQPLCKRHHDQKTGRGQ